jgi:hypothetical protein
MPCTERSKTTYTYKILSGKIIFRKFEILHISNSKYGQLPAYHLNNLDNIQIKYEHLPGLIYLDLYLVSI